MQTTITMDIKNVRKLSSLPVGRHFFRLKDFGEDDQLGLGLQEFKLGPERRPKIVHHGVLGSASSRYVDMPPETLVLEVRS